MPTTNAVFNRICELAQSRGYPCSWSGNPRFPLFEINGVRAPGMITTRTRSHEDSRKPHPMGVDSVAEVTLWWPEGPGIEVGRDYKISPSILPEDEELSEIAWEVINVSGYWARWGERLP